MDWAQNVLIINWSSAFEFYQLIFEAMLSFFPSSRRPLYWFGNLTQRWGSACCFRSLRLQFCLVPNMVVGNGAWRCWNLALRSFSNVGWLGSFYPKLFPWWQCGRRTCTAAFAGGASSFAVSSGLSRSQGTRREEDVEWRGQAPLCNSGKLIRWSSGSGCCRRRDLPLRSAL